MSPSQKKRVQQSIAKSYVDFTTGQAATVESTPKLGCATGTSSDLLRLPNFSGSDGISFQQWLGEVKFLRDECKNDAVVKQAIRRSLKGGAAEVLQDCNVLSIEELINKLISRFGDVLPIEMVMEKFYKAKQDTNENITNWAGRLEKLVVQMRRSDSCPIPMEVMGTVLKTRFVSGLKSNELRFALRQYVECTELFDDLVLLARRTDAELSTGDKSDKQASSNATSDKFSKMFDMINALTDKVAKLENYTQSPVNRPRLFRPNPAALTMLLDSANQHKFVFLWSF